MLSLIPAALLALALSFNVTKDDVRRLLNAGLTEQTIVEFIRRNAPAEPLSVDDITELKAVGATDAVINAMLEASRTSEAVKPPTSTGETYPSTTTYTYSYPQYSYYPYYIPYYYPSYSYYYPNYYYPRSYYYPYSYYRPYYHYSNRYPYRNYHYPHGVSPYRNPQQHHQPMRPQQQSQPRPQPTQPRQGTGTYRR